MWTVLTADVVTPLLALAESQAASACSTAILNSRSSMITRVSPFLTR